MFVAEHTMAVREMLIRFFPSKHTMKLLGFALSGIHEGSSVVLVDVGATGTNSEKELFAMGVSDAVIMCVAAAGHPCSSDAIPIGNTTLLELAGMALKTGSKGVVAWIAAWSHDAWSHEDAEAMQQRIAASLEHMQQRSSSAVCPMPDPMSAVRLFDEAPSLDSMLGSIGGLPSEWHRGLASLRSAMLHEYQNRELSEMLSNDHRGPLVPSEIVFCSDEDMSDERLSHEETYSAHGGGARFEVTVALKHSATPSSGVRRWTLAIGAGSLLTPLMECEGGGPTHITLLRRDVSDSGVVDVIGGWLESSAVHSAVSVTWSTDDEFQPLGDV
jgi:hypothetical protein